MTTTIWVTFKLPGFHCWSDAPDVRSFLRHRHRHLFNFKVTASVEHAARDIEFFDLRHTAMNKLDERWHVSRDGHEFGLSSCEMIAAQLLTDLPEYVTQVEVSEDGESGAIVCR